MPLEPLQQSCPLMLGRWSTYFHYLLLIRAGTHWLQTGFIEATHSPCLGRGLHGFMWKERMVEKRRRGEKKLEENEGEEKEKKKREKTMEGKVEAEQRGERWGEWWRWQIIHVYFNQPGGCTKLMLDVNHLLNQLQIRSESRAWFNMWTWRPHHEVGHLLSCVFSWRWK